MAENGEAMAGRDRPAAGTAAEMPGPAPGGEAGSAAQPGAAGPALPAVPYGEWPSPITAQDVARGQRRIGYPTVLGTDVWWQEGRPGEGGRVTVVHHSATGPVTDLVPAPWSVRTRVHEYGGLSYLPVPSPPSPAGEQAARRHAIVFANYSDQRLYITDGTQPPRPVTPGPGTSGPGLSPEPSPRPGGQAPGSAGGRPPGPELRFADFALSPDRSEVWCVQERHADGKVTRAIVAVPLDGSAADNPEAIRELVTGSDFFAYPTPSPDGKRLAWISWNHPNMPWDGTELRVAQIDDGVPGRSRLVKGGPRESVLAPFWRDATSLYVVTDWTGWWNIYQVGLTGEPPQALYPAEEEFAKPLWSLGGRPFAVLGDGRLAVTHGYGVSRLGLLDPETSELADLDLPLEEFGTVSADGTTVAAVAGGAAHPASIVAVDTGTARLQVLRRELDAVPDAAYLPVPRHVELEGRYGQTVHALVYPPSSPAATGPEGELPPYVVWVHGGPTGHAAGLLDVEKAYFTSRGIGIIDVNYGGSTGYGRLYRERLRRQWGIVDVDDAIAAARWLVAAGLADPARLAIRGGSAGGWTTLTAVTTAAKRGTVFGAAVSYYGVADLLTFAAQTHDFESRYLDGLVGPLPGFEAVYAERGPLGHVSAATCPILLLQGLDDPIVPPQQSEAIASELAAHGIRHAYLTFEGESHGFRKADTITASVEAELSFYGQILGFTPPGIRPVRLTGGSDRPGAGPAAG